MKTTLAFALTAAALGLGYPMPYLRPEPPRGRGPGHWRPRRSFMGNKSASTLGATKAKYGDPLPWMPGGRDCPVQ